MSFDGGRISTIASTGASTFLIRPSQKLLAVRFFANGADGTVQVTRDSQTTGAGSTAPVAVVRSGFGFDWSPAAKLSNAVIVVSSSIDVFGEISS